MTISEKQMLANQQNALKSTGPRTAKGKSVACRNALRHGLLSHEVVIVDGEGAEDRGEFDGMLADLLDHFRPFGAMEEMLVEKIAVCYWRQRRAGRYEVGILREKLDTLSEDFCASGRLTEAQSNAEIETLHARVAAAQEKLNMCRQARTIGQDLSSTYCWQNDWLALRQSHIAPTEKVCTVDGEVVAVIHLSPEEVEQVGRDPAKIRRKLNEKGCSDDAIWQVLIDLCRDAMENLPRRIEQLQKDKAANRLCLQRSQKTGALPPRSELDTILRYESAIERQMYQALKQLERLQRQRAGEYIPPPVHVDVDGLAGLAEDDR